MSLSARDSIGLVLAVCFVLMMWRGMSNSRSAQPAGRCCGPGCRTSSGAVEHYNEAYLSWQRKKGVAKAAATNWTAMLGVRRGETVLDFGAGTGAILSLLKGTSRRVAVEYSQPARQYIKAHDASIETYQYPEQVGRRSVDLIYTTSVLEHVECPVQELRALHRSLRAGGRLVVGVKNEGLEMWRAWSPDNIDRHLYTWNAALLCNMLDVAGFVIVCIDAGAGKCEHVGDYTFTNPQQRKALAARTQLRERTAERRMTHRRARRQLQRGVVENDFGLRRQCALSDSNIGPVPQVAALSSCHATLLKCHLAPPTSQHLPDAVGICASRDGRGARHI